MTRREDDEPHEWHPHGRPSEPTQVGLGVVEGSRMRAGARNGDTPQSPQSYDLGGNGNGDNGDGPKTGRPGATELRRMTDDERWIYIAEQLRETREYMQTTAREAARASVDATHAAERADTCIEDVRGLAKFVRERDAAQDKRDEQLFALLPIPREVDKLTARVGRIETVLGRAPEKLEERASQTGEKTAAELAALEAGTGALGVLGRLVAGQARILTRVGLMAVLGSTVPPIVYILIQSEHGAIVAVAGLVLVFLLIVAVARRRWRRWRSS